MCLTKQRFLNWMQRFSFSFLTALLVPWTYSTVCEISNAALTAFTPKAAAVCTVHLSHNRSDSNSVSVTCKKSFKDLSCSVLISSVVNEPTTSAKNHKRRSAWRLMQILSERLKCLEGFLKVFDLMSAADSLPSLLSMVLVYYHHDY